MTDEELLDDLDELLAESLPPKLEPHHITRERVRVRTKCSVVRAMCLIAEWVQDGKVKPLGKRTAPNGRLVDVWERMKE